MRIIRSGFSILIYTATSVGAQWSSAAGVSKLQAGQWQYFLEKLASPAVCGTSDGIRIEESGRWIGDPVPINYCKTES